MYPARNDYGQNMTNVTIHRIGQDLLEIFNRKKIPKENQFHRRIHHCLKTLENENPDIRPLDYLNLPGGLIFLDESIDTILIPDLHARMNLIISLLFYEDEYGESILDLLTRKKIQIVCLGDGMHAESRAKKRWQKAQKEYENNFRSHNAMDEEMRESLGTMEMIALLKTYFPENFHYLKGNHDNILNENGNGNYPFMKFAYEGPMVLRYMQKMYDPALLQSFVLFEKNFPLFAIGQNFLVSHAEPSRFFSFQEILNYRYIPEVIYGLSWTANDQAEEGSVLSMLHAFLPRQLVDGSYYFGGHRSIRGEYFLRGGGKYIQFHNPERLQVVWLKAKMDISMQKLIAEIPDISSQIIVNNNLYRGKL